MKRIEGKEENEMEGRAWKGRKRMEWKEENRREGR